MSIIRETIKFNNQNIKLKFTLDSDNNFLGYQQEVDNLTTATANELINPVIDAEVRRFNYKSSIGAMYLKFYFSNSNTLLNSFTADEFINKDVKVLNSFFILNYYNTYNSNTQSKIFTNYLTKIYDKSNYRYPLTEPNYKIFDNTVNQFYNWYVPQSYINLYLESGLTTAIGYTKFSFYNAKSGRVSLFYNYDNEELLTPEKMYFKTELDLVNMTWKFLTLSLPDAKAYEISSTSAYVTRVNNTVNNFENKKQVYPSGNTFQNTTGTYINV